MIMHGKVQGVFFRDFIVEHANKLNLKGYVMNKNNHVEAVFEGPEEKIKEILKYCKKGPKESQIKEIKIENQKYTQEFFSFEKKDS